MQIETISVTVKCSVAGMAANYQGSKSFSLNVNADKPAELIEEYVRCRAIRSDRGAEGDSSSTYSALGTLE